MGIVPFFRNSAKEDIMKGTVKIFNVMRGLGYIEGEDGREYFVHKSSVGSREDGDVELRTLAVGEEVEFDPAMGGDKGITADQVEQIGESLVHFVYAKSPALNKEGHSRVRVRNDDEVVVCGYTGIEAQPSVYAQGHFRAYSVGKQKITGFDVDLPMPSESRAVVILTGKDKRPVKYKSHYAGFQPGFYIMAVRKNGQVRVSNVGYRTEQEDGKDYTWAVTELRFYHHYDFSDISEKSLKAQTPTSGKGRDNDGFVEGILLALELMGRTVVRATA